MGDVRLLHPPFWLFPALLLTRDHIVGNMACAANSMEICGGPNGLSLYQLSSNLSSSVPLTSVVSSSTSALTSDLPSVVTTSSLLTSTITTVGNTTSSSMTVSTAVKAINSTTSFASASTTISTRPTFSYSSSATPSPTGPSTVPSIGSFAYIDCHTDNNVAARALFQWSTASNTMTVPLCASYCSAYTYFGVEYSSECKNPMWYRSTHQKANAHPGYCSNQLANTSTTATDGRCNMVCSGNTLQICGGPYGLTLYQATNNITVKNSSSRPFLCPR